MKVLAIVGSPKGKGNTYKAVQAVEQEMKRMDGSLVFEYIILKEANFGNCVGCYQCLAKGEERCPLKDDRDMIVEKMQEADGIIFASPVYCMNVSWTMKNFIDRFSYISHRPRFHGKKAMILSTTGAVGLETTLFMLGMEVVTWGFEIASKVGLVTNDAKVEDVVSRKFKDKNARLIEKGSSRFYQALSSKKKLRASLFKLIAFKLQKDSFRRGEADSADYRYFKSKGWLEKDTAFYCDAVINPVKSLIASIVLLFVVRSYPRPDKIE